MSSIEQQLAVAHCVGCEGNPAQDNIPCGVCGKHAVALEKVQGDLLPSIGTEVLIHLASTDKWVAHTVVGYYVWGDLNRNASLQRVFVRVQDSRGYLNARLLKDVRGLDGTPMVVEHSRPGAGTEPLKRQDVINRFAFLEGLVDQETYMQIVDMAISIRDQAESGADSAQRQAEEDAQSEAPDLLDAVKHYGTVEDPDAGQTSSDQPLTVPREVIEKAYQLGQTYGMYFDSDWPNQGSWANSARGEFHSLLASYGTANSSASPVGEVVCQKWHPDKPTLVFLNEVGRGLPVGTVVYAEPGLKD